jgi:predicted benzoate:H+ symporter BenE
VNIKQAVRWFVPFLYGTAIGIFACWWVETLISGRGVVSRYVAPFGLAALLASVLLNFLYSGEVSPESRRRWIRNFLLWSAAVLLALVVFAIFQPT